MSTTFLTIEEVSKFLRLKTQKLYKLAQKGRIPAYKFGREWRFRNDRLNEWIDRQANTKPTQKKRELHARYR